MMLTIGANILNEARPAAGLALRTYSGLPSFGPDCKENRRRDREREREESQPDLNVNVTVLEKSDRYANNS